MFLNEQLDIFKQIGAQRQMEIVSKNISIIEEEMKGGGGQDE